MLDATALPVGLYEKALPADWPWEHRLAATAAAGYSFLELSVDESDERLARLAWPPGARAELRQAIAAAGVPLLTMCLSGHRKAPLGSRSPQVRARALEIMRRAIELAADVGIRIIQVAGYDVYYEPSDAGTVARYLDGVQQGVAWAAAAGVMLALENVDVPLTGSLAASMAIVRQINSPWFQIYPDMANVAALGFDPVAELPLCAGHLVAVHVKDGLPQVVRGVPFGAGIVPFQAVFGVLAGLGYRGPLTVEMWADRDATGDPLTTARAARQFVAELIQKTF